ncbi:PH and SEC7 domain-containing protein 1-like isoform X2 [Anneissia japonica]|uniref:PH and SEC7 domain-containing protein 1-like isoform X2 n=1 Tax=Anneissia japonica TaxID=1529436 RepID=UPI0014259991|nr:PH and SEC7 domain-containing protein 1-like isoform X2 [Anneissia japonica]
MADMEVCATEKILEVKRGISGGFGFSLMGGLDSNLPPVICDILDNSPAAECPGMQIGDIILEINKERILGKSVKEAVSCLMKSPDCLVLKVKEDAKIRKRVEKFMEPITKDLNQHRSSPQSSGSTSPTPNLIRLTSSGKELEKAGIEASLSSPSSSVFTFADKHNTIDQTIMEHENMVSENGSQSRIETDSFTPLSSKCAHGTRDQFSGFPLSSSTDSSLSDLTPSNKVLVTSALIHREDSSLSGAANVPLMDTNSNKIPFNEPVIHINGNDDVPVEELLRRERRHDSGVGGSSDGSAADISEDPDLELNQDSMLNSQIVNDFEISAQDNSQKPFEETHFGDETFDGACMSNHKEHDQEMPISSLKSPTMSIPHENSSNSATNFLVPHSSPKKSPTKPTPQGALRLSHSTGCLEISQSNSGTQEPFPEEECVIPRSASCSTIDSEDALDMKMLEDAIMNSSGKGLDKPSAKRLAKRLYLLDGFKRSDVAKHLSKRNDFSQIVAEEYLNYFNFTNEKLDVSLRNFLKAITLVGETQERERILTHFSRRYNECNPGKFKSSDTVHTLVCAMLLLNTDLHGQNIGKKMSLQAFQMNLEKMNDGEDFPKDLLKRIYQSIKVNNIQWAKGEAQEITFQTPPNGTRTLTSNPFMELQSDPNAPVFMQGYIMRKNIKEVDGKKTPKGKRSWRMYYAVLKGLILYLHKSDIASQLNFHKPKESHSLHHCLATKDTEYSKRTNVFRVRHSDWSEYLTQCSDANEVQLWMQAFNIAAATLSTPPLPAGCGSMRRFTRPLLPSSSSKLSRAEQLQNHETKVAELEHELEEHRSYPPDKSARAAVLKDWDDKREYLEYEMTRFKTYVYLLQSNVGNPLLSMHASASSTPSPITSSVSLKKPTSHSMSQADDVQRRAPNTKVYRLASSPGRLKNVQPPLPLNVEDEETYL